MTPPSKFVFYLTCLFLGKIAKMNNVKQSTTVHQQGGFISANVGESLTLKCFYESDAAKYYWYKQTLGQKLQLVSITYKFDKNGTFQNEFKDDPRFTLETEFGENHLKIKDLKISDSATYYCASGFSFMFEFGDGTTVSVKGSGVNIQPLVYQSGSEIIQAGDSVTLNCTVHTGSCDGEHSVYWFKDSEESHPGIIYTHGDRNDQCERKPDTQTNTCIYNLSLKNLNLSNAGTYYCAVASCGRLLFGNGTKLDFEDPGDLTHLVYVLSGAVAFTTILSVLLSFLVCMTNKTNCCKCSESQARFTVPIRTTAEDNQGGDSLHYAALSVNMPNRSRRQMNDTRTQCVYSSVKQKN
ncbi:immunoglobulin alpha-2 heavy chain-like [Anabas testudineus]|uniref:Ig-like domain-containing protein n=1 Tax=Anabas testudineus TaxID=64144 RepID=A0A3Q1J026_ANATE|nr:immunoglobulin alpha-2 heavy chain-like [Anabas testudineus]